MWNGRTSTNSFLVICLPARMSEPSLEKYASIAVVLLAILVSSVHICGPRNPVLWERTRMFRRGWRAATAILPIILLAHLAIAIKRFPKNAFPSSLVQSGVLGLSAECTLLIPLLKCIAQYEKPFVRRFCLVIFILVFALQICGVGLSYHHRTLAVLLSHSGSFVLHLHGTALFVHIIWNAQKTKAPQLPRTRTKEALRLQKATRVYVSIYGVAFCADAALFRLHHEPVWLALAHNACIISVLLSLFLPRQWKRINYSTTSILPSIRCARRSLSEEKDVGSIPKSANDNLKEYRRADGSTEPVTLIIPLYGTSDVYRKKKDCQDV